MLAGGPAGWAEALAWWCCVYVGEGEGEATPAPRATLQTSPPPHPPPPEHGFFAEGWTPTDKQLLRVVRRKKWDGSTAMSWAARRGHINVCKWLVEKGAREFGKPGEREGSSASTTEGGRETGAPPMVRAWPESPSHFLPLPSPPPSRDAEEDIHTPDEGACQPQINTRFRVK